MKLFTSISYSSSFLSVKSTLPLNWKPSNYSWFLWLTHLSISKVSLSLINSNSKWLCNLQALFFFLLSCNCLHSLSSQLWYPMILLTRLQPFLKGPLIGLFPNKIFHKLWLFSENNESISSSTLWVLAVGQTSSISLIFLAMLDFFQCPQYINTL